MREMRLSLVRVERAHRGTTSGLRELRSKVGGRERMTPEVDRIVRHLARTGRIRPGRWEYGTLFIEFVSTYHSVFDVGVWPCAGLEQEVVDPDPGKNLQAVYVAPAPVRIFAMRVPSDVDDFSPTQHAIGILCAEHGWEHVTGSGTRHLLRRWVEEGTT